MKIPTLSPSQRALVLGGLSSEGGAGDVGKTPWREVESIAEDRGHIVKDFDGNFLFYATPRIAHLATTGVNAWTKLFGQNTVYADALRALQVQLIPIRAMPAVKRALKLIEETLHPKDDLQ